MRAVQCRRYGGTSLHVLVIALLILSLRSGRGRSLSYLPDWLLAPTRRTLH
jgi:hypothetical protein